MTRETPVLWHLEISHYNEKVRWALDYKGVPHVRRSVTPALQEIRARRLRAGRTLPILELDGRAIGDSSRIIEEIERRWPEPRLHPSDPEQRRRALELEEHFDEHCGHDVRRVLFSDSLTEPQKFVGLLYGPDHPRFGLVKALEPILARATTWRYALKPDRVARSREVVRAALDRIAAEAGPNGYLVGDSFTVADLTAASILAPIIVPPQFPYIKLPAEERAPQAREYRASLEDHAGFQWVLEMYARHRGASAAVAA